MNKHLMDKIEKLQRGEWVVSREAGNSMLPILESMEPVILEPISDWMILEKDDICYSKFHGTLYTHKVYAVDQNKGVLIGNNHGHTNGWTKQVYAKAHLIPKDRQKNCQDYLEELKNSSTP